MKLYEEHIRTGEEKINYLIYGPEKLEPNLPMITFLHGAGERGIHTENLHRHGIPKLIKEGLEIPAVVLVPQCHEGFVWNNLVEELMNLIDNIAEKYQADNKRLSVTGGSMGGFGTWDMGLCYPSRFSAIAPICGGGLSWRTSNLVTTPVFAFHGACDNVVPLVYSQLMVDAVEKSGGNVTLTIFEDTGHNDAIHKAYAETDLIEKLINAERTDFSEVKEAMSQYFNMD